MSMHTFIDKILAPAIAILWLGFLLVILGIGLFITWEPFKNKMV